MSDDAPPARQYAAFISYRHADNKDQGRRWAEWLHQALETYEVPRDLIGTKNRRGETIPATLYPVFRDEEELPADSDLSDNIHRALAGSRILIVLCSPRACESRFVAEEIRIFKELGKFDQVIACLIDGEPNAADDPAKEAAFGPALECLPEPLRRGVAAPGGSLDWQARTEPIAADVRPGGRPEQGYTSASAWRSELERRGLSGATLRSEVRAYAERLKLAQLKLIAGSLGVPLGVLRRRDVVHRARKFRRLASFFGGLALLAAIAGALAFWQWRLAERQRARAAQAESETAAANSRQKEQLRLASRSDHASAENLLRKGAWDEAVAYLGRALAFDPANRAAALRLWSALLSGKDAGDRLPIWEAALPAEANYTGPLHFSPDGSRLAIEGKKLVLLDPVTGRVVAQPAASTDAFQVAEFSPDGKTLVSSCIYRAEEKSQLYAAAFDALSGTRLSEQKIPVDWHYAPSGLPVSAGVITSGRELQLFALPDLTPLLVASFPPGPWDQGWGGPAGVDYLLQKENKSLFWWQPGSGRLIAIPPEYAGVSSVAFSPGGRFAVIHAYSSPKRVPVFDLATGQLAGPPLEHTVEGEVGSRSALTPDGLLAFTSIGGTAFVWEVATGRMLWQATTPGWLYAANFSPDGTQLVTGMDQGDVNIWEARTGRPAGPVLPLHGPVQRLAWAPDGRHLIVGVSPNRFSWWHVRPPAPPPDSSSPRRMSLPLSNSAFVLDEARQRLIVAQCDDAALLSMVESGASVEAMSMVFSSMDAEWRSYDLADGQQLVASGPARGQITHLACSPDGHRVLTRSAHRAVLWDADSGRSLQEIACPADEGGGRFSADSHLLILEDSGALRFFDARTGQPTPLPAAFQQANATLAADGHHAVISRDHVPQRYTLEGEPAGLAAHEFRSETLGTVNFDATWLHLLRAGRLLSVNLVSGETASEQAPEDGEEFQEILAAQGDLVAVSLKNPIVEVWEVSTHRRLASLRHVDSPRAATFSGDGRRLASVSTAALLWDLASGAPINEPPGKLTNPRAKSLALSRDGRVLVTAADPKQLYAQSIPNELQPPPAWLDSAVKVLAGREFTPSGELRPIPLEQRLSLRQSLPLMEKSATDWARLLYLFDSP